jgi:hypothetical protein
MRELEMKDQVEIGVDKAKGAIGAATETVADLAGREQTAARHGLDTMRHTVIETSKQVSNVVAEACQQGTQAADYLSRRTTEQPLLALLLAGAIGYGIAYLVHAQVWKDRN